MYYEAFQKCKAIYQVIFKNKNVEDIWISKNLFLMCKYEG